MLLREHPNGGLTFTCFSPRSWSEGDRIGKEGGLDAPLVAVSHIFISDGITFANELSGYEEVETRPGSQCLSIAVSHPIKLEIVSSISSICVHTRFKLVIFVSISEYWHKRVDIAVLRNKNTTLDPPTITI